MPNMRKIKSILSAKPITEGAGVHLHRVFGFNEAPSFDPFLMLDDFRSDHPEHFRKGFPWHPHRGIETITYVLKGDVEHGDSMGNTGVISSGDVQWMTAGGGIIHQEMPKGDDRGRMHGFQLWANLPADQKMMDPRYRGITADEIPEVELENGVQCKIIAGAAGDATGPVTDVVIQPEYIDCTVPEGVVHRQLATPGHTAFIYLIGGRGVVDGRTVGNRTAILFEDGDHFVIEAVDGPVRFLFCAGMPLGEPVAWRGPVVMNTPEELETAFREYRDGTFVK